VVQEGPVFFFLPEAGTDPTEISFSSRVSLLQARVSGQAPLSFLFSGRDDAVSASSPGSPATAGRFSLLAGERARTILSPFGPYLWNDTAPQFFFLDLA